VAEFVSALKEEIRRLARREARRCAVLVHRAVAKHRKEIAQLKRQVLGMVRDLRRLCGAVPPSKQVAGRMVFAAAAVEVDGAAGHRFSPKGLKSHRKRLDLSADQFGLLLGVSGQSVYAWEAGRARPRAKPLAALAALRAMGKRAVFARLAELEGRDAPPSGDGRG